MTERTMGDRFKQHQLGKFLLLGSLFSGIGVALFTRRLGSGFAVVGFVAGMLVAFLLFSYLLYGR